MSFLTSIATAVPEFQAGPTETKQLIQQIVPPESVRKYQRVVSASGIENRHLVAPLEALIAAPDPVERNDLYLQNALPLAEKVGHKALQLAQIDGRDLVGFVFVSCTGYSIPSLDAQLMSLLEVNPIARRIPISQLGCAGGVAAIGIGAGLLEQADSGAVLLISVELGSVLLQSREPTDEDIVGAILFSDGAAASVLSCRGEGPRVVACRSVFIENSIDVLGLYLSSTGFRLRLSRRLPSVVEGVLRPTLNSFLEANGISLDSIDYFALHPGGPRVIRAAARSLELPMQPFASSTEVLRRFGNMSSATIFFVLAELQAAADPPPESKVLVIAPGTGMTLELVLLEWNRGLRCG